MTKALSIIPPALGEIKLDLDTAQFFPKKFHNGPIEKFFHVDAYALKRAVFGGREAQLLTGERVVVVRQLTPDHTGSRSHCATVLVGDTAFSKEWRSKMLDDFSPMFWARELLRGGATPRQRAVFHLPVVEGGVLQRYHVDKHSRFGCRVDAGGFCDFIDLRKGGAQIVYGDPEGQHPLRLWLGKTWASDVSVSPLLTGVPDLEFHSFLDVLFGTPRTALYETLRFHAWDADKRSCAVFGCDMATLRAAMELFRLALRCELHEAGSIARHLRADHEVVNFYPLLERNRLQSRYAPTHPIYQHRSGSPARVGKWGTSYGGGWPNPIPNSLRRRRSQILNRLGLHAAPLRVSPEDDAYFLRQIGWSWATRLGCESTVPLSGHEVVIAISQFDEALNS